MESQSLIDDDDVLLLCDDSLLSEEMRLPWRILIVDDDKDVHEATELALSGQTVLDRPLEFLHAYSGRQALEILQKERDVSVMFLDVVMETPDAGLSIIGTVREGLGLRNLRIVLRTGQPGYAPDIDVINRYEIDDYRIKSELTRSRLFTTLVTALRGYDKLTQLERSRVGLERVSLANGIFLQAESLNGFAQEVLSQLAALLRQPLSGLICSDAVFPDTLLSASSTTDQDSPRGYRVLLAEGRGHGWEGLAVADLVAKGGPPCGLFSSGRHDHDGLRAWAWQDQWLRVQIPWRDTATLAMCLELPTVPDAVDERLLDLFCTSARLCAANMALMADLRTQAYTDSLVHMSNRAGLFQAMETQIKEPTLRQQNSLAVVDIDNFSGLNEAFGDEYGDQVLLATGKRLKDGLPGCMVSRVASDVFAVLGPSEEMEAQHLQALFETPVYIQGSGHSLTVCIGRVALSDMDGSASEGLGHGFLALKRAKTHGQQQFAQYTAAMATEARERSQMLLDLRHVVAQQGLYMAYQPQIDLRSGRVIGVEALIRWRLPDGRHIPPDRFLPVAEQSGLIVRIGLWVMQTALQAVQTLRQAGHPHMRMAINVSVVQLRHNDFSNQVRTALQQFQVAPSQLELEITESVAALGWDIMNERLNALRKIGVHLALDDFGTGFSSLSYLDKLPMDRVKIDRSFTQKLGTSTSGERIPPTIVLLGHQLGLKVLAEGVETREQADQLCMMGCDEAQGYLYARPMPLPDLLNWLDQLGSEDT